MNIMTESRISASSEVAFSEIEGKMILIKAPMSTMHSLNEVGSFVWKNIQEDTVVSDVIKLVHEQFAIDKETAKNDVITFLEILSTLELIVVKDN